MCKVGILSPEITNWPKLKWVHEALLSLGLDVSRAEDANGFARLTRECDVVILGQKGIGGRWPNLKAAFPSKAFVVQWWFDLIAFADAPLAKQAYLSPDNMLPMLRAMDMVCVKERALLPEYHAMGIKAWYLDQGCPADMPECVREQPKYDVLFWGQGGNSYPERVKDIQALAQAGFKCAWATQDASPPHGVERLPWCHPNDLPKLAGQAQLVLSVDKRHDLDGYTSDRFWLALGMGCCVLRRYSPGLPDGPFIVYRDRHELVQRTREILSAHVGDSGFTPAWSPRVLEFGRQARAWVMESHTVAHRCRQLLESVRTARASAA